MNLINFGHTARIYVKREKGVIKKFEVRLPATKAGKETSLGSRKRLEDALELRDAAGCRREEFPGDERGT